MLVLPSTACGTGVWFDLRLYQLGFDPAVGRYRPGEAATAVRIEFELGVVLTRALPGSPADWTDATGRSYDAVGPFPARYFTQQWKQFRYQMRRHLTKADLVPVDVSQFTPDQISCVKRDIVDNDLGPRIFLVGE